ncbi:MAG: precorrin-3B synthase [Xanthobacteraceae bacterium]|nr:precorrin-3B synthase [Xanthobacteraceae bacterium]
MSDRRGACPALFTPMQTGDGLLARILPAEGITPAAFAAFCAAARRHGNGTIEVSARGSLQVRGLNVASAPHFADEVAALGIAALGVPVVSDPLPDHPAALIDAAALAANLRAAIADANIVLPPKICVVVDGGGILHLDALSADVRLRAYVDNGETRLAIALGGDANTAAALGSVPLEVAPDIVVEALRIIGDARASDVLRAHGLDAFSKLPHVHPGLIRLQPRAQIEIIGAHPLRDARRALGVGLAFGHAEAEILIALAECASAHGGRAVRPAPGRALLLIGIAEQDVTALAHEAARLGFVTRADDPRRRIVACPGAPACASGFIAARAIASELADFHSPRPEELEGSEGVSKDGNERELGHPSRRTRASARAPQDEGRGFLRARDLIHISGCPKGCAHPRPATLTIVGSERGCGIVEHGTARAPPRTYVAPQQLVAHLAERVSEPVHG